MNIAKLLILIAIAIVVLKFIASLLGKGDIPILNQLVTVILILFIGFELFQLGQLFLSKFLVP
ncbi:conserved hypothetical protein [Rippkaea orientalis PCC 8801]|uniref:Uncharacterized protein n=1 Tax=Rippkaea orientalis (strain PCC 8801 / RF-1) TaxID=41431 RepID=B7JZX8_RIPO1|nr:conserved hypothetical protein [Rippkaea orientalis PCC 8801]